MPQEIFPSTYHQTWQAVIEVMKKFDLSLQNIETGVVKTRWIDNTRETNFVDSFSKADAVKAARFRLIVNVNKGFRGGKEETRVTIFRRQLIEQDFLQGWKEVPSDGIHEQVLLYRISRIIDIDNELKRLEKLKEQEALKDF